MRTLWPLRQRRREPEIMDRPDLEIGRHWHALTGLARINRVCGSARILWPALAELQCRRNTGSPLRVLDVATGAGDVPIALCRKARRAGFAWQIDGCDRSAVALEYARERAAAAGADVSFFAADALRGPLPPGYDAVVCSTFLHHLEEEDAVSVLRRMAAATRSLVLVNDLRRSMAGWLLARAGTKLLTRSPVVHMDGPRSVQAAFTVSEVARLADRAGFHGATVARRWPCRYLLTWWKPAP